VHVGRATHGLTLEHAKPWDAEVLNTEWVMHSNSLCLWLSDSAIRCYSQIARTCEVIHKWVGKTCGTIYDRSRDVWLELWCVIRVASSDRSRAFDQSCMFLLESGIRLESHLPTRIEHMTGVTHTTRVLHTTRAAPSDRSHTFRLESGIQPESRPLPGAEHTTGSVHMTGVRLSDRHRAYDQSCDIPAL
jgi:hypothetical protein